MVLIRIEVATNVPHSVLGHLSNEVLLPVFVYVDDLLASGEDEATRKLLCEVAKELDFAEPEPISKCLCCFHKFDKQGDCTTVTSGMQDYCVHALTEFSEKGRA